MDIREIQSQLAAPFAAHEVKFKPGVVAGERALAMPYVDARTVMDRLDEVLGVDGWADDYDVHIDGCVVCKLTVWFGERVVTRTDLGAVSKQPDAGDKLKSAFSGALKRAAVKFGVGRYLARVPPLWVDYDPSKKWFKQRPQLPAAFLPAASVKGVSPVREQATAPVATSGHALTLGERLKSYDARLAAEGISQPGELLRHLTEQGAKAGLTGTLDTWANHLADWAAGETKRFEEKRRPVGPLKAHRPASLKAAV